MIQCDRVGAGETAPSQALVLTSLRQEPAGEVRWNPPETALPSVLPSPSIPSVSTTVDFFISYTGKDRQWAEWIAWVLEDAAGRALEA